MISLDFLIMNFFSKSWSWSYLFHTSRATLLSNCSHFSCLMYLRFEATALEWWRRCAPRQMREGDRAILHRPLLLCTMLTRDRLTRLWEKMKRYFGIKTLCMSVDVIVFRLEAKVNANKERVQPAEPASMQAIWVTLKQFSSGADCLCRYTSNVLVFIRHLSHKSLHIYIPIWLLSSNPQCKIAQSCKTSKKCE